jgi:hypothetical protein
MSSELRSDGRIAKVAPPSLTEMSGGAYDLFAATVTPRNAPDHCEDSGAAGRHTNH